MIEDPVGWRPVRGEAISHFWDAFIAPNDIEFVVHHDWIDGPHVVRDVTVVTTLATGLQVTTPAHLRYELVEREGALTVQRMAAHWEVLPNVSQLMRPRAAHLRSMAAMNASMLRNLAPGSTARFVGAIRSVGKEGQNGRCGPISAPGSTTSTRSSRPLYRDGQLHSGRSAGRFHRGPSASPRLPRRNDVRPTACG